MFVKRFFEPSIAQASYLIGCQRADEAIVIDANRDIEQYIQAAAQEGTMARFKGVDFLGVDELFTEEERMIRDSVREFVRLMLPKMVSHPVEPMTFLFFTNVASGLAAGSVTVVSYARNFQSVPVSLIGISFSLAVFPTLSAALPQVAQIPLGGTATGTGLNTHPEFAARVRARHYVRAYAAGCLGRLSHAHEGFRRAATESRRCPRARVRACGGRAQVRDRTRATPGSR